jgi:hypothetical protein
MGRIEELKKNVHDKRWSIDHIFVKAIEDLVDGVMIAAADNPLTLEQRVEALERSARDQGRAIKELAKTLYEIKTM